MFALEVPKTYCSVGVSNLVLDNNYKGKSSIFTLSSFWTSSRLNKDAEIKRKIYL